jgi:hypothetical protein
MAGGKGIEVVLVRQKTAGGPGEDGQKVAAKPITFT